MGHKWDSPTNSKDTEDLEEFRNMLQYAAHHIYKRKFFPLSSSQTLVKFRKQRSYYKGWADILVGILYQRSLKYKYNIEIQ